ncbi:MAG: polyphosphate kinase 1, partial [Acidobacteria bacterium]|nr:polyphosphate kinase 1 [Acidobacteriota bacterium]
MASNDRHRPTAVIPRELSQLAFNARVLQEARDESVPLVERLRFLGIFSSNQDEYYRVRVAALQRIQKISPDRRRFFDWDPSALLSDIQRQILRDQSLFLKTYDALLRELEQRGIRIITEADLSPEQGEYVQDYFVRKVRPHLTPIMLERSGQTLNLDERDIYLGVRVLRSARRRPMYA